MLGNRISLFEYKWEQFFLLVPLVFIILIPFEIFFREWLGQAPYINLIVVNTIFFNFTHVALTFLMLFTLPELEQWIDLKNRSRKEFWFKNSLIFLGFALIFLIPELYKFDNILYAFVLFFLGMMPLHHTIFQVKGLSACYSQQISKLGLNDDELKTFKVCEKIEKWSFYLLFANIFLFRMLIDYINSNQNVFGLAFDVNFLSTLNMTICFLIVGALAIAVYKQPKALRTNKPLYLARCLSFPLAYTSILASLATVVLHGVEYVCVFSKMNGRSDQPEAVKSKLFFAGGWLMFGVGIFYTGQKLYSHHIETQGLVAPLYFTIIAVLTRASLYLHYYLDRQLFRMRDPITRQQVSSLLI